MPEEDKIESLEDSINSAVAELEAGEATETVDASQQLGKDDDIVNDIGVSPGTKLRDDSTTEAKADVSPVNEPDKSTETAADPIQEQFMALTPETQQFVIDRINEREAAIVEQIRPFAPVLETVSSWHPYLESVGIPAESAVHQLLTMEQTLRQGSNEQKLQALEWIVKSYGIQFADDAEQDPLDKLLAEKVGPLQAKIDELQGTLSGNQAEQKSQVVDQFVASVVQFAEEKGPDGNPLRPYFKDVQEDFTRLVRLAVSEGQSLDFKNLYDRACWSDPTVRAKMQAVEQNTANQNAQRDKLDKVKKAQLAGAGVSGGVAEAKARTRGTMSIEQSILEAERELGASI